MALNTKVEIAHAAIKLNSQLGAVNGVKDFMLQHSLQKDDEEVGAGLNQDKYTYRVDKIAGKPFANQANRALARKMVRNPNKVLPDMIQFMTQVNEPEKDYKLFHQTKLLTNNLKMLEAGLEQVTRARDEAIDLHMAMGDTPEAPDYHEKEVLPLQEKVRQYQSMVKDARTTSNSRPLGRSSRWNWTCACRTSRPTSTRRPCWTTRTFP